MMLTLRSHGSMKTIWPPTLKNFKVKFCPQTAGCALHAMSVKNSDLSPTNEIKVLGVTLDDRLNFKSHVDDICNRASRQINSFKRFSKYLKIDKRLSVYKSFIQSNFSYCPVAWLFYGRKNSNKLEKLQERAFRIVFGDFSSIYEFLCERANTLPLSFYRLRF